MGKNDLGSIIHKRRKELGLTAEKLAQKAGVDRTYISKIENHSLIPAFHIILKLEDSLGINIRDFYLKEKEIVLLAPHSGSNTKKITSSRGKGKSFSFDLVNFVLMNPRVSPKVNAVAFLKEFAPRKANDEDLIEDLTDTIRSLEKIQAKLI